MTGIASRPHVVEVEPQVRPFLDRHLVVRMEVALSAVVPRAKLGKHCLCRWVTDVGLAEQLDDIRLPAAVHTSPGISLETENPKPAMVCIVSAIVARATTFVMLLLALAAMGFALTARSEFGTARNGARTQYPRTV